MTTTLTAAATLTCALVCGQPGPAPGEGGSGSPSAARLKAMRAIADRVRFEGEDADTSARLERFPEPIYRYNDAARDFSDGSVWAWGRPGRPAALLTVASQKSEGRGRWLCEMTAVSDGPFSASVPDVGARWQPRAGAGIEFRPIPGAAAPASAEARRLRQLKEQARRFRAVEFFSLDAQHRQERFELRLLPQPILRYSDAQVLDGAVFFFAYGNNPEIVFLVESRREAAAGAPWSFGLTRVCGAEVRVSLDGREVWTQPRYLGPSPRESYWVFTRPIFGEDP